MDATRPDISAAALHLDDQALPLLEHLQGVGPLSLGWPWRTDFGDWLGDRLTWWPQGLPNRRTTAIISSRWGRQLDRKDDLFRVLRSACAQLDPQRQALLTAEGTTTHAFICRLAQLFGLETVDIRCAKVASTLTAWLAQMTESDVSSPSTGWTCFVSPSIDCQERLEDPIRDRITVLGSDQLLVLHLRSRGNLMPLIQRRLHLQASSNVYLALGGDHLVPGDAANTLMEQGAVGWLLLNEDDASQGIPTSFDGVLPAAAAPIVSSQPGWDYLIHCTRSAHGPWPDQSNDEYLDELLLGHVSRDHSSLAALVRILRMQRLIATNKTIRGGTEVVSFTAAGLQQLSGLRTFQSHRGRWDFQPYGICIRKDRIERVGGRPVIYGDDGVWQTLDEGSKPYFQKTDTPRQPARDWRSEREWRHVGDFDLRSLGADDALVFVPSPEEAAHVARVSRWPVTVVCR